MLQLLVGGGEHNGCLRLEGICDPGLGAIQHEVISLVGCYGGSSSSIGSVSRFREREAAHSFAGGKRCDVVLLLGIVSEREKRSQIQGVVHRHDDASRGTAP